MTDTATQWTREQVERLALDFMGFILDPAVGWIPMKGGAVEWASDVDGASFRIGWNPFTDAAADYDVLLRARQVWPREAFTLNNRMRVINALRDVPDQYVLGDYARAVLAVLDSQEANR